MLLDRNAHIADIMKKVILYSICGIGICIAGAHADITRGPYLQDGTSTRMTVMWLTSTAQYGVVTYLTTDEYARAVTTAVGRIHAATLTGLEPGATYEYRVVSGADTRYGRFTAFPTETGSVRIAVLGDMQFNRDDQRRAARAMGAWLADQKPHAILMVGDAIHNSEPMTHPHWDEIFDIFAPLLAGAPYYMVTGNRETQSGLCPGYHDHFMFPRNGPEGMEELVYAFTCGPVHIAGGSIHYDGGLAHEPGTPQFLWLSNEFAHATLPWNIFLLHHPLVTGGASSFFLPDSRRTRLTRALFDAYAPWLEKHTVDIVLQGHDHRYERSEKNGVTYLTTTSIEHRFTADNPWSRIIHAHGNTLLIFSPDRARIRSIAVANNMVIVIDDVCLPARTLAQ